VHSSVITLDWQPIVLQSKEGLALPNSVYAYGMHILMKANKFSYLADLIGTISWKHLTVASSHLMS
jgi:histidine ammonia-lyase